MPPEFRRRLAHRLNIGGTFDAEREFESRAILLSKCADTQLDARKIQPLARTQFAADGDGAFHLIARHALHHQLHETVVEENAIAGLHHA